MNNVIDTPSATAVCAADDILPNTGVFALVQGRHVAVFRVGQDQYFAIDNIDPKNGASVLSRGLIGTLGEHVVVASPLYKHHFVLATGVCLENADWSVRAYPVSLRDGQVCVAVGAVESAA